MLSHSVMYDSGLWPARLLCPRGFSRQEYRLPFPPPGDLPNNLWNYLTTFYQTILNKEKSTTNEASHLFLSSPSPEWRISYSFISLNNLDFFSLHNIIMLYIVFYNLQKLKFKSLSFKIPVRTFCLFAQSLIMSGSFGPHGL